MMPSRFRSRVGFAALLITVLCAMATMAASPGGPGYFSNVPLITQDGKTVHFYDDLLKGKSVVINLIYTHCSASCPLETAKLSQVQRILGDRVGKDIFFYSISIDPMQDSPQVLKAYADKFNVGKGWLFLTGKKEDIGQISKQLGLASLTDLSNPDGHLPALMIGKEATNQWMRNSAVDNPQFLAMTILHFLDGYKATKPPSYADIGALPNVGRGEYLFKSRCAACHTIGKGDRVGPDLLNVTASRDHAWLARYVAAPDRVLASGDPIARKLFTKYRDVRMPNLSLSAEDVQALLPFIEQQSRAVATSGTTNFVLVAADGRATAPFLPSPLFFPAESCLWVVVNEAMKGLTVRPSTACARTGTRVLEGSHHFKSVLVNVPGARWPLARIRLTSGSAFVHLLVGCW